VVRELVLVGLRRGPKPGKSFSPDTPQPLIYMGHAPERERTLSPDVVILRPTG
jgi:hypothetical protein